MKPTIRNRTRLSLLVALSLPITLGTTQAKEDYPSVPPFTPPSSGAVELRTKANTPLPSKRYNVQFEPETLAYRLAPLDERSINARPNQIGINRSVDLSRARSKSFINSDGTQIHFLAIKSPGAVRLRAHFDNFQLPPGAELYVYGISNDSAVAGPYTGKGPWNDKTFWSSSVDGDTLIIEYCTKTSQRPFNVLKISHIYKNPKVEPNDPDLLGCHVDASCSTAAEMNAVGRMVFTTDTGSFVCTGTLLNNRNSDGTPYFLTANHCVSTQTVAQTVEIYWFYQTTACNSGALRNWAYTGSGGNLLATDPSYDFALIRLIDNAPSGTGFAGWDARDIAANTPVHGFHHPDAFTPPSTVSYLRRSDGAISGTNNSCSATGLVSGYRVNWSSGAAEQGCSGSGIWHIAEFPLLIGVLSCGPIPESCNAPNATYSKFSQFYSQVQPFLYPTTNTSTLLGNISTRLRVETGDNALIGGFIVTGTQPKRVIVRALGPSLPVGDALPDPVLELRNSSGALILANDDWRTAQQAEIIATGIPPTHNLESAIVATLPANSSAYTAIVRGYLNGTGIGVVEAYDLDQTVDSKLANISTRGFVSTGDNVMIGGTIILGSNSANVLIRAIGPSLINAGVSNALSDPTLELRDGNGALIAFNDDWRSSQQGEIIATGIPPTHNLESAILATLPANNAAYTAIVRGYLNGVGVALVEAYQLQ